MKSVFTTAFGVAPETDFESVAYGATEGWHSIAPMALVAAIESRFDILLDTDDVIALSSYPEAKEF